MVWLLARVTEWLTRGYCGFDRINGDNVSSCPYSISDHFTDKSHTVRLLWFFFFLFDFDCLSWLCPSKRDNNMSISSCDFFTYSNNSTFKWNCGLVSFRILGNCAFRGFPATFFFSLFTPSHIVKGHLKMFIKYIRAIVWSSIFSNRKSVATEGQTTGQQNKRQPQYFIGCAQV
jgi:hypothetical protein